MQNIEIKGSILVVDDDVNNLEIIKNTLYSEFKIFEARNGREAINMVESLNPDFVLLDWEMPVMNGLETLKHLKSDPQTSHLPVIMMTGYMTEVDRLLEAYENGVIDFIRKPFDILELKARANSIFQLTSFYKKEMLAKENELLSFTLKLAELDQLLNNAISKIGNYSNEGPDCKLHIEEIKNMLHFNIDEGVWKNFDEQFMNVHPDFVKNLLKSQPLLTSAEIKLASLLRLKLSTKEIAGVLHQTYDSIRVSRTRLRKKLNLETEDGLVSYLLQY
jgi:CheY-like chemotaxis protein